MVFERDFRFNSDYYSTKNTVCATHSPFPPYIKSMEHGSPSFQALFEEVKLGNRRAQKTLYEQYYAYAKNICLHYSSSAEEAVEIMNDGFLSVFNHIELYDNTYSFKTWLRKILIHKSIDYFRKYHKIKVVDPEYSDPVFISRDEYPNLDRIDELIPALRKLSPAYRMVLNLYVLEDFTHDEIAEKLKISPGTSRSNLYRAIENLRKLIDPSVKTGTKIN